MWGVEGCVVVCESMQRCLPNMYDEFLAVAGRECITEGMILPKTISTLEEPSMKGV